MHVMHALRAQHTHAHMHTTRDALRRGDRLAKAGDVEEPKYLPRADDDSLSKRSYLRVPLTGASTPGTGDSATVWLLQLSHIKTGGKKGPSFLGSRPLNKKIRLCVAAMNSGHEAAAAASRAVLPREARKDESSP